MPEDEGIPIRTSRSSASARDEPNESGGRVANFGRSTTPDYNPQDEDPAHRDHPGEVTNNDCMVADVERMVDGHSATSCAIYDVQHGDQPPVAKARMSSPDQISVPVIVVVLQNSFHIVAISASTAVCFVTLAEIQS